MIVRVLTARVGADHAGAFNVAMRGSLNDLRAQPGLAYAKLARRLVEGGEEVILFEEWLTPADLYRWTGGNLQRARLLPGAEALLENLSITHYESLDRTPEELGLELVDNVAASAADNGEQSSASDENPLGGQAEGWR